MKVANWGCFFRYEFTTREYVTRTLFPSRNSYTRYIRPHSNAPLGEYAVVSLLVATLLMVHTQSRIVTYRAKRTAGYLHVSDVIFIVTYTSPLKIKAHGRRWALKTKPRDSVLSFRTSVYFYVYKVAMQTN